MARRRGVRLPVGRDPETGKFVPLLVEGRAPFAPISRTPRRDPVTGRYIPRTGPVPPPTAPFRHPRTGRFISANQDRLIRAKRVTQKDLRHILIVSPKFQRRLTDLRGPKRQRVRRAMLRNLRAYRLEARRALRRAALRPRLIRR